MNSAALVTTPATLSAPISAATVPEPPPETKLQPDDTFSMAHLTLYLDCGGGRRCRLYRLEKVLADQETHYLYQTVSGEASCRVEVPHTALTTEPPPPPKETGLHPDDSLWLPLLTFRCGGCTDGPYLDQRTQLETDPEHREYLYTSSTASCSCKVIVRVSAETKPRAVA